MAKQKKQAAKPRKAPAKKAAAKPRKVVEQKRGTIEQRIAAEKLTAHKAAKVTAKQARAQLAAERARLPPDFPIIPFADTLVGREFYARVNCKLTPNRKGKLVNRCDTQRVTVVGGAAPSAAKPKTKQVFAVQKGQRYLVPDRELRRAVRVPTLPPMGACETYGEQLRQGGPVPPEAWDECPQLPDAGAANDTSFEPFEFDAPKANHHGGYHAAGDPLGAYMPPLAQWPAFAGRSAPGVYDARSWSHPALSLRFGIAAMRGRGYFAIAEDPRAGSFGQPAREVVLEGFATADEAYRAIRAWYAAQTRSTVSTPEEAHRAERQAHLATIRKPNRAPQGVPGGTYYSDRADAWIGQTVGGDDYAGEIRARAVARDGAPAHVVGGHVMTRARALAGVRREDIRNGVLPAPTPRARAAKAAPDRPMRALPPRVPTMRPPPMPSRFGVPALEERRPRPSPFGVPALEDRRPRPPARPARPASRNLGHWAVVKRGDEVVIRSAVRLKPTLRGTVLEVIHNQTGEPGVELLDPQRLQEGNGQWVPVFQGQREGDSVRAWSSDGTLEIGAHQPGNLYITPPGRRPWRDVMPALEERRPLPPRAALPPRFGVPALEERRPRPAPVAPPPAAPAPRRASDEELMRAMMEELAAAGIVVKQNRRPPPSRRRY